MEHITDFGSRYEILEGLGEGTFSNVYKIREITTGKYFACKIFVNPEDEDEQGEYDRSKFDKPVTYIKDEPNSSFIRELTVYMELSKDYRAGRLFPRCYGFTTDRHRLILELYNSSMANKVFSYHDLIKTYKQLLESLNVLHSHGFAHRDIKPYNMLWSETKRRAVLSDLGSCRLLNILPEPDAASKVVATLPYYPPEILDRIVSEKAEWKYTHAMDIWALGVSFFNIAGGKWADHIPWDYDYLFEYLKVIYGKSENKDELTVEQLLTMDVSARYNNEQTNEIVKLLMRMLEWDPENRISAREALDMDIFGVSKTRDSTVRSYDLKPLTKTQIERLKIRRYTPYIPDIRNNLLVKTKKYIFRDIMDLNPEISYRMYSILCDWLSDVSYLFGYHKKTFYIGLNMLDNYMIKKGKITKIKFQLYGATCQYIAACYQEVYHPMLQDYVKICANAYTIDEYKLCIKDIIDTIDYDIFIQVPFITIIRDLQDELNLDLDTTNKLTYLSYVLLSTTRQEIIGMTQQQLIHILQKYINVNDVTDDDHPEIYTQLNKSLMKDYTGFNKARAGLFKSEHINK